MTAVTQMAILRQKSSPLHQGFEAILFPPFIS
jgi:hypothetical protein